MIDVARDREGVLRALEAVFEEDHARARIDRIAAFAGDEQRERLAHSIPRRELSPGYYRWAEHLLWLDAERQAGISFSPRDLAAFEVEGLVIVGRARAGYAERHPPCSVCGVHQDAKYSAQCCGCGVKFRRKGK